MESTVFKSKDSIYRGAICFLLYVGGQHLLVQIVFVVVTPGQTQDAHTCYLPD